jgi:hypothetical protein
MKRSLIRLGLLLAGLTAGLAGFSNLMAAKPGGGGGLKGVPLTGGSSTLIDSVRTDLCAGVRMGHGCCM